VSRLDVPALERRLGTRPRARLAHLPTPLQPLERLSEALGAPPILLKRDDCTGLATGGNKARKLEYLLGRALAEGATDIVTFGALQSNHARQTAAACAVLGLGCELVLVRQVAWPDPAYTTSGNLLLDGLLGATVHLVDDQAGAARVAAARRDALEGAGRTVGLIPPGGSDATGALGYVGCAAELHAQCIALGVEPGAIWLASSTTGTQAGLVVGLSALGASARVTGVDVYAGDAGAQRAVLRRLVDETAALLDLHAPGDDALFVDANHVGGGYGIPDAPVLEAIALVARSEGVLLDPVYTGKAMAALIASARAGALPRDRPIVFLHTGGTTGLFAYPEALGAGAAATPR
jgi:D-cysteine desulfhydrase family pyridoxal phosphate-dependent enzyme